MKYSLIEVIESLVGDTSVHGETHADNRAMESLSELYAVAEWAVSKIYRNAQYATSFRASEEKIGKQCKSYLNDLQDYFGDAS